MELFLVEILIYLGRKANCTYIYHNRIDKNRAAEGLLLSERPKNMIGKDSTLVWKLGMALVHQLEEFALVE